MRKNVFLNIVLINLFLFVGCDNGGFGKNEAGLKFRFVKHDENAQKAAIGDVMDLHVKYMVEDSMVFEDRLWLSLDSARHQGGSIETGFAMMGKGDSAIFKLSARDFYIKSMRQAYPERFGEDAELTMFAKLYSIKKKAELERERQAMLNQSKLEEEQAIELYISKNNVRGKENNGLWVSLLRSGKGKRISPGKSVTVHYSGSFLTTGQVFDSSYEREQPFSFRYGTGEVITAWEMGLRDAREGDKFQLIAPSWFAYGAEGVEGIIPPFATLLFEIEIIKAE